MSKYWNKQGSYQATYRVAWVVDGCFITMLMGRTALGKSLIVGIPSADVAKWGQLEYTHKSQWGKGRAPGNLNCDSFIFFTFGVASQTEQAVWLINLGLPGRENVALGVGYKTISPLNGEDADLFHERTLTPGQMVYVAVGPDRNITRDRAGLNALLEPGTHHIPLSLSTFIGGLEQPLTRRVSLVADRISAQHEPAALITGVPLNIGPKVMILAYKRANDQVEDIDTDAPETEVLNHF